MIEITHIAHSCFLIDNGEEKLIIDPYDPKTVGYDPVEETVNYILISHDHSDHNYTKDIKLLDNVSSFKVKKVESFHDDSQGSIKGKNTIHVIDTKGIRICHLGDLGHLLTDKQLPYMQDVDVLLIPVGGFYTIDYKKAVEVIKQINPITVIPMHYRVNNTQMNVIDTVDNFINEIKNDYKVIQSDKNKLEYEKTDEKIAYIL